MARGCPRKRDNIRGCTEETSEFTTKNISSKVKKKKPRTESTEKNTKPRTGWHCRTKNLIKINSELVNGGERTKAKIDALKKMGFDGLLYVRIKAIRSEPVKWLCQNLDCSNRMLPLPNGKKLQLKDSDVNRVYKLPLGVHIKLANLKGNDKLKDQSASLEKDLGLKGGAKGLVPICEVYDKLVKHPTRDPTRFAKMYVLYALATLLAPTGGGKVDLRYAPYLEDIDKCKNYNWAGHVLEKVIKGVVSFQKGVQHHPNCRPGGDMHFFAVNFFDYLDGHGKFETPPSCSKWSCMKESKAFTALKEALKNRNSMSKDNSDSDIVPTDVLDVKIMKLEAFEQVCQQQLNYWKEKTEETESKLERLRAQKARVSKGGETSTRKNLGRDFSEVAANSTRAPAKAKEVCHMKRKRAVRSSKEGGPSKRRCAAIPARMSPDSPLKQYVRRKRSRQEAEEDASLGEQTVREDSEAPYSPRYTFILSSPPSSPLSQSPPWLGTKIAAPCMEIIPHVPYTLPTHMILRAMLFVAWYRLQLGEEVIQEYDQTLEEANQKVEETLNDNPYSEIIEIRKESCQEDVHDYTAVELPMTNIKIRRPLVPTKIVKSPISVDWQFLGDPITILDRSVTKLVWGKALEDEVVVFDDGKLIITKKVSMTCAGTESLDDRIIDAYCDYLHRKQMSTDGRIKKLCFPIYFARQAHKEVKSKFIPDADQKKLVVSKIIEAVASDGKWASEGVEYNTD